MEIPPTQILRNARLYVGADRCESMTPSAKDLKLLRKYPLPHKSYAILDYIYVDADRLKSTILKW